MVQLELEKRCQQLQQQQVATIGEQEVTMHVQKEEKEEERVLGEVKVVEEEQEENMDKEVREEKEDPSNAPSPPSPPLNEADHCVEQVGELVASPPPALSLSSPQAEAIELEEQRQAGDNGEPTVVVKEDRGSTWWIKRQGGRGERCCSSGRWWLWRKKTSPILNSSYRPRYHHCRDYHQRYRDCPGSENSDRETRSLWNVVVLVFGGAEKSMAIRKEIGRDTGDRYAGDPQHLRELGSGVGRSSPDQAAAREGAREIQGHSSPTGQSLLFAEGRYFVFFDFLSWLVLVLVGSIINRAM